MTDIPIPTLVASLGFLAGALFGATAQRTNFCTMGALSDAVLIGDQRRLRMWLFAIAVALLGSQMLDMGEIVDLNASIYLTPNLGWLGAIVGGGLFGFGMTLAGGCLNRNLVRLGAGNLKSLVVVLVAGLTAYMTLRGLIGVARIAVIEPTNLDLQALGLASQGLPELLRGATGLGLPIARLLLVAVAVIALAAWCLQDDAFRRSPRHWAGAAIIGALVPVGWLITGVAGADDFDPAPLASFTFVAPVGEAIIYLLTFSGATINFGIGAVGGVIAGACIAALAGRQFRLETFADPSDMLRHLLGAVMMGMGGVLALGCTVGQGITGLSTLALGSFIALGSIIGGGLLGLKYLEEGSLAGAFRAWLPRRAGTTADSA